mgnify:CR=1 FL=1
MLFSVFRTAKCVLNSAEMSVSLSCFVVKVLVVVCREFCETNDANRFSVVGNGESAVGFTDLYMVFGVSELCLCVSELGS